MVYIKVLGPGCRNCERLESHAIQAAEQVGAENPDLLVSVEKVTDVNTFLDYGLLTTPGLVINEELVSSGKIPPPSQIAVWIREVISSEI
jgi:small redox-active disulfide protein 2